MISALAELGKTHKITLSPEYDDKGNVSVVVMLRMKAEDDVTKMKSFTVDGTVEEVDAGLAEEIGLATTKVTEHLVGLAALDAQLKEEKDTKVKAVEAAKAKPKVAAKPAVKKKPAPPAKKVGTGFKYPNRGGSKQEVVTRTLKDPPKKPLTPAKAVVTEETKTPPAVNPDELGDMFKDLEAQPT